MRLLGGVFGRSVRSRASDWGTRGGPQRVYLFAHETLRITATEQLGPALLASFRERLHAWADRYRHDGWPSGTPLYLLRGYPSMLEAERDVARLVVCATDQQRHDRMLDISGGDAAAIGEIRAAQDLILQQQDPDLLSMARLAIQHGRLSERNANIPTNLPAVWARLGHISRAESLARSITDPGRQAWALAGLAQATAATGDLDRAETTAHAITHPYQQARALADLAQATAATGDLGRARRLTTAAETTAHAITHPYQQAQALAGLAQATAATGDLDRAETTAHA
ncbi:MAG TPA: hypothetical protein VLJ59_03825, partial [Mycobacteriales bacterium]|nr:hypothetical protein [Mycobacteriales bacterium]